MLTGRKLLLADDSPTVQKVLGLTFGDEGMAVSTVSGGLAALAVLAADAPDIVLADVHLAAPNGYQLCEHVKRTKSLQHIPVVLLRGTFEPFDEAEARRVGADGVFMTKPFQSIRELMSKVGNLLGGQAEEKQTAEPAAPDTPPAVVAAHEPFVESRPEQAQAAAGAAADNSAPSFPWARAQAADAPPESAPAPAAPVSAFNDFDMDDQTIQTTPAAAFGTHSAPATSSDEFDMQEIKAESEVTPAPASEESFVLLDETPPTVAPPAQAERVAELSYTGAASAPFALSAPAIYAPDDALLDLGERAAPVATHDDDEFILELDDESYAPPPAEPQMVYAEGMASTPAEAAAPLLAADALDTDMSALDTDAQTYAPPPAWEETPSAASDEPTTNAHDADEASPMMPDAGAAPVLHETAAPIVESEEMLLPPATDAAQHNAAPAAQADAAQLSPELIDAIARRVVELMSDSVVREVAWEVVPDLAERLIRQQLDAEREQAH